MAYIGEIGKRIKVTVKYVKTFDYTDYKYSYYGTTHHIHSFKDEAGNVLIWKSTNCVEFVNSDDCYEFIPEGSTVELTGTVKAHGKYKEIEQTEMTRCKFGVVEKAKSKQQIESEKKSKQVATLCGEDFIWNMSYKQYKEHYSDCETVSGSFSQERGRATISVIIREGRLKKSGTRGMRYSGYEFSSGDGKKICYRAVSEDNAYKHMVRDCPERASWECTKIYSY